MTLQLLPAIIVWEATEMIRTMKNNHSVFDPKTPALIRKIGLCSCLAERASVWPQRWRCHRHQQDHSHSSSGGQFHTKPSEPSSNNHFVEGFWDGWKYFDLLFIWMDRRQGGGGGGGDLILCVGLSFEYPPVFWMYALADSTTHVKLFTCVQM